ncbi:MAG: GNAT family N-acetyltransferase [Bacteroidales bacterium]|nr:GNAT family N-acetyltransferase [Bacteroidales bacterium]MBO5818110.1 GNAT family N-acetyltransferase [Bacteroidales bacterium]
MIEIIEVNTDTLRKEFALIPYRLYQGNPYWVPPMLQGEIDDITPEKNPYFRFCEAKFWIAQLDGKTVGRIGAIIHHAYIEKTQKKMGRLTRCEFIDDAQVVDALFETAENWCKEKGMLGVLGPLGFSNLDQQGLLVEGFEQLASVASAYHHEYYHRHFERLGFTKEMDWVEFRLALSRQIPEKAIRMEQAIMQRYQLKVVDVKNKKMLRHYGQQVFQLLNKSFYNLFSFVPLDEAMIEAVLDNYLPVINTEFVKLVMTQDERIVGFIVPVPSLSKTMQIAKGKLGLRALISLLWSRRHNDTIDTFLTGVDPEFQSKGVVGLLMTSAQRVMIKRNMLTVETTGMLENNQKAIEFWKNYDHIQHKRKRCYRKMF